MLKLALRKRLPYFELPFNCVRRFVVSHSLDMREVATKARAYMATRPTELQREVPRLSELSSRLKTHLVFHQFAHPVPDNVKVPAGR